MLSDDAGNSRYLEYNYAGKLRAFRTQAGTSEPSVFAHYLYDSGGNRVKKLVRKQGGGYKSTSYIDGLYEHSKASTFTDSIPYLRIGTWSVGGEEGEQSLHHILDGASRIATLRTGAELGDNTPAVKYNLEDHLNSSCILLDANGTLINKEEYTPFGETSFGSYGRKRYRYNGKEKDEESGLYNYGMRYYAPWMCRFVSVDPLAPDYPFYTPYQYAGNKPINAKDLDGLEEDPQTDTGGQGQQGGSAFPDNPELFAEHQYNGKTFVNGPFGWSEAVELHGSEDNASFLTGWNETTESLNSNARIFLNRAVQDPTFLLNELYDGSKSTFNWFAGLTVGAMGWKSHPLAQEVNQDLNNVVNFVTSIPDMSKEELGSASAKLTSSAMSAAATWAFFKSFRAPASGRNNLVPSQKTAQSPVVQSVDDVVSSANSAAKGLSAEGAVWAQKTFSGTFSAGGKFAGQTVEGVAGALRSGALSAADVPINVVVRNGQTFILNTRSSAALMQAGIPRSAWNVVNQTGVSSFESMLTDQLGRNGLINGTNTIRQSGTQLILSH